MSVPKPRIKQYSITRTFSELFYAIALYCYWISVKKQILKYV